MTTSTWSSLTPTWRSRWERSVSAAVPLSHSFRVEWNQTLILSKSVKIKTLITALVSLPVNVLATAWVTATVLNSEPVNGNLLTLKTHVDILCFTFLQQFYEVPISMKAIFDYIDTFSSRIREMEQQKRDGVLCKKEDKPRSLENFLSRWTPCRHFSHPFNWGNSH